MNRRLWLQNMTQGLTAPLLARASTVSLAAGSALSRTARQERDNPAVWGCALRKCKIAPAESP